MTGLSGWEKWMIRLSFGALGVFLVAGALVIHEPTDARINAFGILLFATLIAGVVSGLVALVASGRWR